MNFLPVLEPITRRNQGRILLRFDTYSNINQWAEEMGINVKKSLTINTEQAANIMQEEIKRTFSQKQIEYREKLSDKWVQYKRRRYGIGRIALIASGELRNSVKEIDVKSSSSGKVIQFIVRWKPPKNKGFPYWLRLEYGFPNYGFLEESLRRSRAIIKYLFGRNVMMGIVNLNRGRWTQMANEKRLSGNVDILRPDVYDVILKYS